MSISFATCARTPLRSIAACATSALLLAALTGCAGFTAVEPTSGSPVAPGLMVGSVHGGQQPVTGAHVHLFEVGATGYGSASNNIITTATGADAYGNYVLTDASGNFSLPTTAYTCTKPTNQTYLLAIGGNPGLASPATNNTAIALVAILGQCGNIANLSNAVINEISTVSAVTALQQFIVDPGHIGSSANGTPNLVIATGLANDLVPTVTGIASTTNAAGAGTTPQAKVNTIGNSLAPCINSAGPTSTDCAALFAAVTPSGGTQPTTVFGAMQLIAQNPTNNVANIVKLSNAAAPFQPTIASLNDLALSIVFGGHGLTSPQNIVIDASGNAFATSCPSCSGGGGTDAIVGISSAGAFLTGTTGYTAGIHSPTGLAFDVAGNLWSTNDGNGFTTVDQVVKMTGPTVDFAFNDTTISQPIGIAIDAAGNAWVTNQGTSAVVQVTASGTRTLAPVTDGAFSTPTGIAIDGNRNIFAAGSGSNNILKINSAGTETGLYTGGLSAPIGVSIDNASDLFSVNSNSSLISEINGNTGATVGSSPYGGFISNANVAAVDGVGGLWVANYGTVNGGATQGNVLHFNAAGTLVNGSTGLEDASLVFTAAGAIDGAGNFWVTSPGTGKITEFLGVAAPVVTPIAAASAANTLGTKP